MSCLIRPRSCFLPSPEEKKIHRHLDLREPWRFQEAAVKQNDVSLRSSAGFCSAARSADLHTELTDANSHLTTWTVTVQLRLCFLSWDGLGGSQGLSAELCTAVRPPAVLLLVINKDFVCTCHSNNKQSRPAAPRQRRLFLHQ